MSYGIPVWVEFETVFENTYVYSQVPTASTGTSTQYSMPVASVGGFSPNNIITIIGPEGSEANTIQSINELTLTLKNPLAHTYGAGANILHTATPANAIVTPETQPSDDAFSTVATVNSVSNINWPVGTYLPSWNTMYGAGVDAYIALDNEMFQGFSSEGGFDNGLLWITDKMHAGSKRFSWFCGIWDTPNYPIPTPPTLPQNDPLTPPYSWWTQHDLSWWCSLADEIVWEVYALYGLAYIAPAIAWVRDNCSIRQGVATMFASPTTHGASTDWSEYLEVSGPDFPMLTELQQRMQAAYYLNQLKQLVGHFDMVELLLMNPATIDPTVPDNSVQGQSRYMLALHLNESNWPPEDTLEEITATTSTNQNITVPIGWNT